MKGAEGGGAGAPVQVELSVSVVVEDAGALLEYARRRYTACWSDEEWIPADIAEAVLEALVLSNENPSPADYGIEIAASRAREVPKDAGRRTGSGGARLRKGESSR